MKKAIFALVCGVGLSCLTASAFAANTQTPTSQTPSANGQIHLAGWWWDDNDDWRGRRDWQHWRNNHQPWCDNHPKKCAKAYKRHRAREWCRNHPYKCERD